MDKDDTPTGGHEEFWCTRDYGGSGKALSLSKSSLGNFVYHLMRLGGRITDSYASNANYDRSYVQMGIAIPTGKRAELESLTGITLEKPSHLKPAGFSF